MKYDDMTKTKLFKNHLILALIYDKQQELIHKTRG